MTTPAPTAAPPTITSVIERLHNVHSDMWGQDVRIANQITKAIYELTEIRDTNTKGNG